MRRRRKAKTSDQALRSLALAERWEDIREHLARRLARDPYDTEARTELSRLNRGLPLRATENALTRKRSEEQEMQEELATELARYREHPGIVEEWEPGLVASRRKRIALIRSVLRNRMPAEQEQESFSYLTALSAQGAQHRKRQRRLLWLGIGLPLLAAAGTATALALHQYSERAESALRQALQARDMRRVEHALLTADSGANRFMNSELAELIRRARVWKERTERIQAELHEELTRLETGTSHISTLPLVRRAELERAMKALPGSQGNLQERWTRLCEQEAQALEKQRQEVLRRFSTPLPPLPQLNGNPAEDEALLKQQQAELQEFDKEWQAARELFGADTALGKPLTARLAELRQLREDITALRRTVSLLPTARNYAQYRQLLTQHNSKSYAPALRVQEIRDRLPDEGKLRNMMQGHGRQLPPGMPEAARQALLEGGPSFTPAFPANAQQVHIIEDLFTDSALQKELYEMSAPTLPHVIIEQRPEVNEESVRFTPSPLSPGYSLDTPRRITWHNPQGVFIRRIDATPLLREMGITRENFFHKANLPTLLDTLLHIEHRECPALARAYVFKRLLELIRAHEWPTMLGVTYAPTLRADARSFRQLLQALPISLETGCWLLSTPESTEAEQACARWLHERRHRHYAQEIARNFSALVHVHPRYIGFVNREGEASLFRHLPEGTLLWYVAEDGLTITPLGEKLEAPVPYSPLFIVAKD